MKMFSPFPTQVLKHKIDNIKRMSSHPLMPLYLTGGQDGSVQMWEWGHQQAVCTPRPPGTFAKGKQATANVTWNVIFIFHLSRPPPLTSVTRCRFSQHGNKFGIADGDGKLSLWQVGLASQCNRSFFVSIALKGLAMGISWCLIWFSLLDRLTSVTTNSSLISCFSGHAVWWQQVCSLC